MSLESVGEFQHIPTRDGLNLDAFRAIERIDFQMIQAEERHDAFVHNLPQDTALLREEAYMAQRQAAAAVAEVRVPSRYEKIFFWMGVSSVGVSVVAQEVAGHATPVDGLTGTAFIVAGIGYLQSRWGFFDQPSGH